MSVVRHLLSDMCTGHLPTRVWPVHTPFLALDDAITTRNVESMATHARDRGLDLRPHAKTHKMIELGNRQIDSGAIGLTVATIGEAEVFSAAGVDDLFIAYPLWLTPETASLLRQISDRARLRVGVGSIDGAQQLARLATDTPLSAMIELDSGHHRSGIDPHEAGTVADVLADGGIEVIGVFTFPGHSYAPGSPSSAAADEASTLAAGSEALRSAGCEPIVRSGGSTPSAAFTDADVTTEIRPGVYVFNDAQQVELGTCELADVALTAYSTVVQRDGNRAISDSGSKILGADRPSWTTGFGRVIEDPDARIVALSEHHATIEFSSTAPPPGTIIHTVPNHVCTAVNLVDRVAITTDGEITGWWDVAARGRF